MQHDVAPLARQARATAATLSRRARQAERPGPLDRLRRGLGRGPRALRRKLAEIFREHWDVGVFDVVFGSLKAFAVYPALYLAGLAWTIALMETLFLNTQLWTAGYLVARRRLRSLAARRTLGVPLERLDALRRRRLGSGPPDERVHRFVWAGRELTLRVRGRRLGDGLRWILRQRSRSEGRGRVRQAELRGLVSDPEFRFLAESLRDNPFLYEEVLIARLLAHPGERAALLGLAAAEPPLAAGDRRLLAALGEGHAPTQARLVSQGDALRQGLRARLGRGSLAAACLHWIHASEKRILFGRMRRLEPLEYALLADVEAGRPLDASPHLAALRRERARIAAATERLGRWVERALGLADEREARDLGVRSLEACRLRGVPARRARASALLAGFALPQGDAALVAPALGHRG